MYIYIHIHTYIHRISHILAPVLGLPMCLALKSQQRQEIPPVQMQDFHKFVPFPTEPQVATPSVAIATPLDAKAQEAGVHRATSKSVSRWTCEDLSATTLWELNSQYQLFSTDGILNPSLARAAAVFPSCLLGLCGKSRPTPSPALHPTQHQQGHLHTFTAAWKIENARKPNQSREGNSGEAELNAVICTKDRMMNLKRN